MTKAKFKKNLTRDVPKEQVARTPAVDPNDEQPAEKPTRLLTKRQVLDRVPVTYPTLWAWMRKGKFPRAFDVGGKTCWLEAEIEAWIAARPLRLLKGDQEAQHAAD